MTHEEDIKRAQGLRRLEDELVEDLFAMTDAEIEAELREDGVDVEDLDRRMSDLVLDALAEAEDRRISNMTPDEVLAEAKAAGEDTAEFAARMRDFVERAYAEIVEKGGRS